MPTNYHETTKHFPHRYARSAGYMDWEHQPDPFRRYQDAPLCLLPLSDAPDSPPLDALYRPLDIAARPLDRAHVGLFFQDALGLSAWKAHGGVRWELRCNPSSGNLHPTEGYALLPPMEGLAREPGVYHYAPREHGLEQRGVLAPGDWESLMAPFPAHSFLVGLTSIHWREAWKYGERAYRYCNHDVGHALAAMSFSAAALGWRVIPLDGVSHEDAGALLGVDRDGDYGDAEREEADLLALVCPVGEKATVMTRLDADAKGVASRTQWRGTANVLSAERLDWKIIGETAERCRKPSTPGAAVGPLPHAPALATPPAADLRAHAVFQQRRSAVAMDGQTSIAKSTFFRMLEAAMPHPGRPPWHGAFPTAAVHLAIFVHRVEGLAPGLYMLVRAPEDQPRLREALRPECRWDTPADCPGGLPLFLLEEGDCQRLAAQLSCMQDIAGQGAFSLGMVARFEEVIHSQGPWMYPRLFWETGMIGQVLYLEAEAAGVRGTGIGCFFDDGVHEVLGIRGRSFQSLYHFTVGGPVADKRLQTLPPYDESRKALS